MLRELADGAAEIAVTADTVADALQELVARHPGLQRHLFDEHGRLRRYVNVYLNDEDTRFLNGAGTPVSTHDVITIVPSVAGGREPFPAPDPKPTANPG
jgi:molybdopterin converting factor small subunit